MEATQENYEELVEAILAGKLDDQLAPNSELAQEFAIRKRLDSLFALLRESSECEDATENEGHPTQIDRFVIRRQLGEGAFGRVYLADDPQLNRKVAVKVARAHRFSSRQAADRFLEEARFNARLNHPGIVSVYDAGRDGKHVYIVLEYVPGHTLEELLDRRPLRPAKAAELVAKIADALDYAHEQKCYHRDLKPGNILLDEQGQPHIADFGLALSGEDRKAGTKQIVGTPAYMSPEQVRGTTKRQNGRTDIWSLGVILYQMLTGKQPFWDGEVVSTFKNIQKRAPVRPREIKTGIPLRLDRICLKALSKKQSERFATASEMAKQLRSVAKTGSKRAGARSTTAVTAEEDESWLDKFKSWFWSSETPVQRKRRPIKRTAKKKSPRK